jgi:hypothetical protein
MAAISSAVGEGRAESAEGSSLTVAQDVSNKSPAIIVEMFVNVSDLVFNEIRS